MKVGLRHLCVYGKGRWMGGGTADMAPAMPTIEPGARRERTVTLRYEIQ